MRSLILAALLLPLTAIATGKPETKQGSVVFADYYACGELIMHVILEPGKEPLIVYGYKSGADRERIIALWHEAVEAGNAYEYHVHNADCQRT